MLRMDSSKYLVDESKIVEAENLDTNPPEKSLSQVYSNSKYRDQFILTPEDWAEKFFYNLDTDVTVFFKPKKSGGFRRICSYSTFYLYFYKALLQVFEESFKSYNIVPIEFIGSRKGFSIDNMARDFRDRQTIKSIFGCIDVVQWFDSIQAFPHIDNVLQKCLERDASKIMAEVCTYKGKLAQGNPVSSFLANLVAMDTWGANLLNYVDEAGLMCRVYVDNIILMGDIPINDMYRHLHKIRQILRDSGFDGHKISVKAPWKRQRILGVNMNMSSGRAVAPPASLKRNILHLLYRAKKGSSWETIILWTKRWDGKDIWKGGYENPERLRKFFFSWIMGQLGWIAQFDKDWKSKHISDIIKVFHPDPRKLT